MPWSSWPELQNRTNKGAYRYYCKVLPLIILTINNIYPLDLAEALKLF
jgi:hypothetical protein